MRLLHRPWRLGQSAAHLKKFDHIIIETTGLADPAPVAQTFLVHDTIKAFARIDGIVTLVDAKHVEQAKAAIAKLHNMTVDSRALRVELARADKEAASGAKPY